MALYPLGVSLDKTVHVPKNFVIPLDLVANRWEKVRAAGVFVSLDFLIDVKPVSQIVNCV